MGEEWREWRWVEVRDDVVVYRAESQAEWERLEQLVGLERAVAQAGVRTPPILEVRGRRVVYQRIVGTTGSELEHAIFGGEPPADRYASDVPVSAFGRRFASSLGRTLAALQTVEHPGLPAPSIHVLRIAQVLREAGRDDLIAGCVWLDRWAAQDVDRVLCHADLHFANLFVDSTGEILAVLDFADARHAPRGFDHQFTLSQGPTFARLVLEAYNALSPVPVHWADIVRFHVLSAYDHVDHQAGTARFEHILSWIDEATAFAGDLLDSYPGVS